MYFVTAEQQRKIDSLALNNNQSLKYSSLGLGWTKTWLPMANLVYGWNVNILETVDQNDMLHNTNDVCEVLYKDSPFNLVPIKNMAAIETTNLSNPKQSMSSM